MEIAVALAAALTVGWLLARRRRGRREHQRPEEPARPEELAGLLAGGGVPFVRSRSHDEELDLEEGALDPDELEGDPLYWDEGADDEVG